MTIAIYHFTPRLTLDQRYEVMTGFNAEAHAAKVASYLASGAYDCVALLQTEDLDSAFEQTQHIHEGWNSPEVLGTQGRCYAGSPRSTAVGDVMVRIGVGESAIYVVSGIGFTEITELVVRELQKTGFTLAEITTCSEVQELLK